MIPDALSGPWNDDPAPDELRCEFGICRREAEVEITTRSKHVASVRVCSIHIAPVLGWGVPELVDGIVRYLPCRPESAA